MRDLANSIYRPLRERCQKFLEKLDRNGFHVPMKSMVSVSIWLQERTFRITGSRCKNLFIYSKTKELIG